MGFSQRRRLGLSMQVSDPGKARFRYWKYLLAAALGLSILAELSLYSGISQQTLPAAEESVNHCAINLFGLPRAFKSLVLPSLIKNVIAVNANCDYFVHYYFQTEEPAGRSGFGGSIDPNEILLLREAVEKAAKERGESLPLVEFISDTEDDFWKKYTPLLEKIRTTKVPETGKDLYYPWKAKTYNPVTVDNIIKMWHSIQESFKLMERKSQEHHRHFSVSAMLRSDVLYVTPIDVRDGKSNFPHPATVPNFGNHPVSDRIIYGPTEAIKIWATQRFSRLEDHVQYIQKNDPGWGMHSERFINATIFPEIRKITQIRQHPTLCFFRARPDQSVWVSDCEGPTSVSAPSIKAALGPDMKVVVEQTLGRSCPGEIFKLRRNVKSLNCNLTSLA